MARNTYVRYVLYKRFHVHMISKHIKVSLTSKVSYFNPMRKGILTDPNPKLFQIVYLFYR